MIDFESQSARTLLAIAGERGGIDVVRCGLAFAHLGTAGRMRGDLQSALVAHRLSNLQFAILVLLSGTDSKPMSMALLADHSGVSRAAVTDALDSLEKAGLAIRTRWRGDRRAQRDCRVIPVALTRAGRERVEQAIGDYLQAAVEAYRHIEKFEDLKATLPARHRCA